ncbi:MAG: hypothetical protein K6D91_07895 [Prevotella sp.]|nr:hypothetical protein [Prevotella sp.]
MFCYQKNFSNPTLPVDEAQFWALVRASKWNENIDKYRETHDAALKRKLPAFIFQATFDETTSKAGKLGRWRKQAATRLTGLVVMDVDHVTPPDLPEGEECLRNIWGKAYNRLTDEEKARILLVYITPSGHGLKIVFKARTEWGNLIDNQHQMAKLLGVEVDESCKDASRMSFICKETDILYLDKELFTYENKAYGEKYDEEYRNGHSEATLQGEKCHAKAENVSSENVSSSSPSGRSGEAFKGIPYSEIISEWWKRNGGEPQEGERNVKLYQLAVNLRAICDNNRELLLGIMPRLGLEEQELRSIVESACKEPPKGLSKVMQSILAMYDGRGKMEKGGHQPSNIDHQLWDWGAHIEALSEQYPQLKDICKGLKKNQYPAAMFVAGGLLMTLMTRCTYRFYHRPEELRRLNNSTLIIGDPASGKSFATRLFKLLASPIVAADKVGKDAINAYREQMRTKGANKEKPKKPKVVVRIHPARTSNAQFIQDMVNAVENVDGADMQLHMLTFDTELDNTLSLQKGGAYIDKQALQLKAFHNEEDGQAYSNVDSVFQEFYVVWNYIYTGTPIALKKMVNEQNFGSGLATRLTCIPLPATNFQMMGRESFVDYDSDERLKAWAEKLDRVKGELSVQKIVDELYDWTARRMEDAAENDSKADEMLLKRCAYHGLNFAAPFIVMRHWDKMKQDGQYWCGEFETDEVDWKLAELIVNIQYACQRYYFGAMAENYFDNKLKDASVNVRRQQKTIEAFQRLPEEFTLEDTMRCFNLSSEGAARSKTHRLIRDHLVEKVNDGRGTTTGLSTFRKTGVLIL